MKWLETSKSKLVKEPGGNEPHLEVFKVLFIHCNIVNNNYLQHSRVWYIFVSNKSFCQLLDISPNIYIYIFFFLKILHFPILKYGLLIKTINLEIKDKINITLVVN